MTEQRFLTVIEAGSKSFDAFAPDIQGCIAFSKSRQEISQLFKTAAEAHLRQLAQEGQPVPAPETRELPGITIDTPVGAITLEWTKIESPLAT